MRTLIVSNPFENDLGVLESILEGSFITLDRSSPQSWGHIGLGIDLVLCLGSDWSVYWDKVSQSVRAEGALIREFMQIGVPVLGICYGAQVMSYEFGGYVTRGPSAEIGWTEVQASESCSVLAGKWMQWHYDFFTAPPRFEVLAFNDAGVQAIRYGRALGLQFHPEANKTVVSRWVAGGGAAELTAFGISAAALLEETSREVPRAEGATKSLIRWFFENVACGPIRCTGSN